MVDILIVQRIRSKVEVKSENPTRTRFSVGARAGCVSVINSQVRKLQRSTRFVSQNKKWRTNNTHEKKQKLIVMMARFHAALVAILSTLAATTASSLRSPLSHHQTTLENLLNKLEALENRVSELEENRRLDEDCGFQVTADGSCQIALPLEVLGGLTTNDTEILGELVVEGNTLLGSELNVLGEASISGGTTWVKDLTVGSSLEVYGDSDFGSNPAEAQRNARSEGTVLGEAKFHDLNVGHNMNVQGETRLDDKVYIEGRRGELVSNNSTASRSTTSLGKLSHSCWSLAGC